MLARPRIMFEAPNAHVAPRIMFDAQRIMFEAQRIMFEAQRIMFEAPHIMFVAPHIMFVAPHIMFVAPHIIPKAPRIMLEAQRIMFKAQRVVYEAPHIMPKAQHIMLNAPHIMIKAPIEVTFDHLRQLWLSIEAACILACVAGGIRGHERMGSLKFQASHSLVPANTACYAGYMHSRVYYLQHIT